MLKTFLIILALFFTACEDKKVAIDFASEDDKFLYCMSDNIDKDICAFYRPFILVSFKAFSSSSCPSSISSTDTCKTYVYSSSFKNDFKKNSSYCEKNKEKDECILLLELFSDINSFYGK